MLLYYQCLKKAYNCYCTQTIAYLSISQLIGYPFDHENLDFDRFTEAIPDDDTCKQQHHHHNSLNLNFANIKDYSFSLLNSDLGSINDKPASMPDENTKTRGFIDAWSAEKAATLTSSNSLASLDLPHSGLSLSLPNDQIDLRITDPLSSMQSPVMQNVNCLIYI